MNKIYERILRIKRQFPCRKDWNYKLERLKKFPNNPEKRYCNSTGFEALLSMDLVNYGSVDDDVAPLFNKIINKLYPNQFTSWKNIDETMSYEQVECVFEMALKYAKNYVFS